MVKNPNSIADSAKKNLLKIKPSPLYTKHSLNLIKTGNLEDHMKSAGQTDWVIEAIIEKYEPKISLFKKLEKVMADHTIISTNTSGIPLSELGKEFSNKFKANFLGTHFFNPPRYLRLVEVIKGPETSDDTLQRINKILTDVLNKVPVTALDVPCFIANRIGVHAMVNTQKLTSEFDLTIEEIDKLTGSLIGRPKTGTYRLADLVGLDTLGHIITNLNETLPATEAESFQVDTTLEKLISQKHFGKKVGAGYYKKEGKTIKGLDLHTGEYRDPMKPSFPELKEAFKQEALDKKLVTLFDAKGKPAEATQALLVETIAYAAELAPTISNNISDVDTAMELGFGWDMGPFKTLDVIGIENFKKVLQRRNKKIPDWIEQNFSKNKHMYSVENATQYMSTYEKEMIQNNPRGFQLKIVKQSSQPIFSTPMATLWDIRDDVCLLEFHSKMNSQDLVSLKAIVDAVEKANESYRGLVIANQAPQFCAGANLGMILMDAINGEYENIDQAVRLFQKASMAIKYSSVPVVVSPHNLALGGGCEFVLHSQRPVISPETYMGLVEVGVGLLPAGGGTKELTLRALNKNNKGIPLNNLAKYFELIAMGKVSTSGKEAFEMGLLDDKAIIATNDTTRIDQAKAEVLAMSAAGYRPPEPAVHIEVLGTESMAAFETAIYMIEEAKFGSKHDGNIARAIGKIMSGGNLSPGSIVDEDYLLELEIEEFMKLIGTKKTQERIEHILKKGKPLRN